MYLDYYNIADNPFDTDKGKTSLWLGGNLPKVASTLKEAIMERKGIVFLTGDSGTGKSTIIKMVTDILQDKFSIATHSNPELSGLDFFNVLSVRFKFNKNFKSKSSFLVHLSNFLRNSHPIDKNILLTEKLEDILQNVSISSLIKSEFDLKNNVEFQLIQSQERLSELSLKNEWSKFLQNEVF